MTIIIIIIIFILMMEGAQEIFNDNEYGESHIYVGFFFISLM